MSRPDPFTPTLQPWADDVPLRGERAPKNDGQIKHLIEYLLTVHKRFGNTAVTTSLQWGATALWKRDEQAKRIAELEEQLAARVEKSERGPTEAVLAQAVKFRDASPTMSEAFAIAAAQGAGSDDKRMHQLHDLLRDAIGNCYPSIDDVSRDVLWAYLDELLAAATAQSAIGLTTHEAIDLLVTAFVQNHYPSKAAHLLGEKGFIQDEPLLGLVKTACSDRASTQNQGEKT